MWEAHPLDIDRSITKEVDESAGPVTASGDRIAISDITQQIDHCISIEFHASKHAVLAVSRGKPKLQLFRRRAVNHRPMPPGTSTGEQVSQSYPTD